MTPIEVIFCCALCAVLFAAGVLCGARNAFNAGYVRGRQDAVKAVEEAFNQVGRDE